MARPKKYNAEYFSHDSNMRSHRKLRALGQLFGIAGYGVWCILLEMLTEEDHNKINLLDELDWTLRTPEFFGVSATEIRQIIEFCVRIGLLKTVKEQNKEYLYCEGLNDRLAVVYEKRNQSRKATKEAKTISATETPISATETPISVTETPISVTETTQSKVKESKVKESKVNKVECSINTATHTTLKNKVLATEILPKLASDTQYLQSIVTLKNCTPEQADLLFQYFQAEQIEVGREYPTEADARKHFSKWFDFTQAEHGKFIATQQKRNAFAQRLKQPKQQKNSTEVTIAEVNELGKKIMGRIEFLQKCSYTTTDAIIKEANGILHDAQQLNALGQKLPEKQAVIQGNVTYITNLANQFILSPAVYLKPAQEPSNNTTK